MDESGRMKVALPHDHQLVRAQASLLVHRVLVHDEEPARFRLTTSVGWGSDAVVALASWFLAGLPVATSTLVRLP